METVVLKAFMAQIKKDTGLQMIKGNTTNEPPPLPYGMYNVTSPYIREGAKPVVTIFSNESGPYEKFNEQYRETISFSVFAEDSDSSRELAKKLRRWFLFSGKHFLQDHNIVVYRVHNVENRTTFLVDDYEYKHGFDVQFRATDEEIRPLTETIEKINAGG